MSLKLSNKWIIGGIALLAGIVLLVQLFSSFDLFNPKSGTNSTLASTSDKTIFIKAIQANVLIPAGFGIDFTTIDEYTSEGSISNNDIEFFINYSYSESKLFNGETSGNIDPLGTVILKNKDSNLLTDLERVKNTDFFRPKSFEQTVIQYTEIKQFDTQKDKDGILGYTKLSILEKGSVLSNGSFAKIRLKNLSLTDKQKSDYLQLSDKILLSIKAQ
jgi:hypothetical protein